MIVVIDFLIRLFLRDARIIIIIIANEIERIRDICIVVAACIRHRDGARRIDGTHVIAQALCRLERALRNLIADAPDHNGRMILVALDHRREIAIRPVVEIQMIVVRALLDFPAIKGFIHDEEPHVVRQVEKFRRRRIMRCADRIDAHILHDLQLTRQCADIRNRAKAALVMMQADTMHLHWHAIQRKSRIRIKTEEPHTERRLRRVEHRTIFHNGRLELVELRLVHRPERGIWNRNRLFHRQCFARPEHNCLFRSTDKFLVRSVNFRDDLDCLCLGSIIRDLRLHICHRVPAILRLLRRRRRHERAPLCDVYGIQRLQPDIALDTRSRVPSACRLVVLDTDRKHIRRASRIEIWCQIILE